MTDKPDKTDKTKSGWFQRFLGMEPERLRAELERLTAESLQARAEHERAALEAETASAALKSEQARAQELERALELTCAREQLQQERGVSLERQLEVTRAREASLTSALEQERAIANERERALFALRQQLEQEQAAAVRCRDAEAKTRRDLEQLRTRLAKLEQAHATLELQHKAQLGLVQLRDRELQAREIRSAELTQANAQLEAARRKLLDENDALSAQLDEAQHQLKQHIDTHQLARSQWLVLSLRFWKALQRVVGQRATQAISLSGRAERPEGEAATFAPMRAGFELDQLFANLGLSLDCQLAGTEAGLELRLRGPAVATDLGTDPLWYAAVVLAHLEGRLGRMLGVEEARRTSEQELYVRLSARAPALTS